MKPWVLKWGQRFVGMCKEILVPRPCSWFDNIYIPDTLSRSHLFLWPAPEYCSNIGVGFWLQSGKSTSFFRYVILIAYHKVYEEEREDLGNHLNE